MRFRTAIIANTLAVSIDVCNSRISSTLDIDNIVKEIKRVVVDQNDVLIIRLAFKTCSIIVS